MKWLKRVLVTALVVLIVLVLGAGGLALYDSQAGEDSAAVSNITFEAEDGTLINGYLALPDVEGQNAPYPAVLMVHEWWGLNAEITEMADLLAEQGYVVLAPDTYRGKVATSVPGALTLRLSADTERVNADMRAAFAFLAAHEQVDAGRIGVMGFCYGGGVALRHGIDNPRVSAVVNLYGDTVDDPQALGALLESQTPVLGVFGELDAQIPLTEVEAFRVTLEEAGLPHFVIVYGEVGHAFVNPETIQEPGSAQDAWLRILRFLEENLKQAPVSM